jgi:hypothetical protein
MAFGEEIAKCCCCPQKACNLKVFLKFQTKYEQKFNYARLVLS